MTIVTYCLLIDDSCGGSWPVGVGAVTIDNFGVVDSVCVCCERKTAEEIKLSVLQFLQKNWTEDAMLVIYGEDENRMLAEIQDTKFSSDRRFCLEKFLDGRTPENYCHVNGVFVPGDKDAPFVLCGAMAAAVAARYMLQRKN